MFTSHFRAMVLAADHFLNDYPVSGKQEMEKFTNNSRFFAFFRDFDKHVGYVIKLIGLVNVNLLTQENVSCLNTSLVILMINRKRGRLEDIIRAISQRNDTNHSYDNIDEASAHNAASGKRMLENLRTLLVFW